MDVTPQELRGSEIKDSWRGYDRDDVDDLLERAAVTIEGLTQKLQEAASRPAPPAEVPLPSSREDADMLQRTLLLAQRAADDAVNEAQARARQILDESEAKAQHLVSDAEATARRIAEGERRRLEAEIEELSSRREKLRTDADALDEYASSYRERLRAAIEADLASLSGEVEPPSPRPELHDVIVPPRREPEPAPAYSEPSSAHAAPAGAEPAAPVVDAAGDEPAAWDTGPDTRAMGTAGTGSPAAPGAASASNVAPSPIAAPPRPAAAEWPPPAPPADGAPPASAESSWLAGNDEWAPAEHSWDPAPPWEQDTAHHEPFASETPIEANPVDTDALDDDAFFASLREAVRDDAPLGPRDEDQPTFFHDDIDEERRRFRRRR